MTSTRRSFVAAGLAAAGAPAVQAAGRFSRELGPEWTSKTAQTAIPRWRGFNVMDLFQALPLRDIYPEPTSEDEFRWLRDWGFNFIRVPTDYWYWIDSDWRTTKKLTQEDAFRINPAAFDRVDRLVDLGRKYGIHVHIGFHRAPGYCVNNPQREPFVLWTDRVAEDAFAYHWRIFAHRYRGVSHLDLSFNLLNEPRTPGKDGFTPDDYRRVMLRAADEIRRISPQRVILVDGYGAGNQIVENMIDTGIGQAVHAYWPGQITHYRAPWVDRESNFPFPAWPMKNEDGTVKLGREQLEEHYQPWADLARKGVGVHCSEAGCHNKTPHAVFLAWFGDTLEILQRYGIGFAVWNLRGSFGILNSGRQDVDYEDWHGARLDRKALTLLQRS